MGDGRNLLDILNLAHARTTLPSCVAWLLDPAAEHGLGDLAVRSLGQALAREAVHSGALADRDGVLAASRVLRADPRPALTADVHVDHDGPHVKLTAGDVTLRLQPCLDEPPPGVDVVEALRAHKTTLVVLTPGAPPGDADPARPAAAVWPLGELVAVLRALVPGDAYGYFLAQLRDHLADQLAWVPPEGGFSPPPARPALPQPTPPASVTPSPPARRAPGLPSPPVAPALAPAPPPPPAAAPPAADPTASSGWDDGWGSKGHEGDWLMDIMTGDAPAPAAATGVAAAPAAAPPPARPTRSVPRPAAHESHLDLDRADLDEGARGVREVLSSLQKAIHFFRLYPPEHPNCTQAVDETTRSVREYLGRFGALEVQVQRDGVALRGVRILEEQGRATDFSFILYPEGIRSLTFDDGIEPREVHQFVETLSGQDPALTLDHDLPGALWRREFPHIHYLTHDQLSPAALKAHHDATLAPVARRISSLSAETHRSTPASDEALERLLRAPAPLAEDDPALLATRPERAADFRLTPAGEGRQRLFDAVFDPFLGDLLGRAADIVAWSVAQEDSEPDPGDVAHFVAGCVVNVLWQGDLVRAAELLGRAAGVGALHPELVARLTGRDALALIVRALRPNERAPAPSAEAAQAAVRYLSQLGAGAVSPVARLWGRLVDLDVRRVLHGYLATQVASQPEALVPLTEHADTQLAAEALQMFVDAARHPACRAALERFAADPALPARQQRARQTLEDLSGEGPRRRLLELVESGPARDERLAAARGLAEVGNALVFERLCALTQQKEFAQRDDEELDAILGAITRLGGVRSVRVLTELSERRSLLGRKDTQRLSLAATNWLNELKKSRRPS
jgi:hypothetical protein